jgi:hypothetical protein
MLTGSFQCGYKVTGSFQCGNCWVNIHLKCGKPAQSTLAFVNGVRLMDLSTTPPLPSFLTRLLCNPIAYTTHRTRKGCLRRRLFPCPRCGLAAAGSHQLPGVGVLSAYIYINFLTVLIQFYWPTRVPACLAYISLVQRKKTSFQLNHHRVTPRQLTMKYLHHKLNAFLLLTCSRPVLSTTSLPPPKAIEERAGDWRVMPSPASFNVHLDVVDRSQLHDYRLETHCILIKSMQQLYPGWRHNSRKKYLGADGDTRGRIIGSGEVHHRCDEWQR